MSKVRKNRKSQRSERKMRIQSARKHVSNPTDIETQLFKLLRLAESNAFLPPDDLNVACLSNNMESLAGQVFGSNERLRTTRATRDKQNFFQTKNEPFAAELARTRSRIIKALKCRFLGMHYVLQYSWKADGTGVAISQSPSSPK